MAKYWYDTFFPTKSENLTKEEQIWIDKLNRIGIGHFRPLVTVIISRRDFSPEERIESFKAIERFIIYSVSGLEILMLRSVAANIIVHQEVCT